MDTGKIGVYEPSYRKIVSIFKDYKQKMIYLFDWQVFSTKYFSLFYFSSSWLRLSRYLASYIWKSFVRFVLVQMKDKVFLYHLFKKEQIDTYIDKRSGCFTIAYAINAWRIITL